MKNLLKNKKKLLLLSVLLLAFVAGCKSYVDPDTKAIYLQCKLNTSNKKVTGYKLTLTDPSGEDIWSSDYISSIDDVSLYDYGNNRSEDHGV